MASPDVTDALGHLPQELSREPLDVSVVMVTWNSQECLEESLLSIVEHLRPAEIVLVDNGSTDATVEVARRSAPEAVIVETGMDLGFGRGCNVGVERATRGTIIFISPDVVISRVSTDPLVDELAHPRAGLLVPRLSSYSGETPRHLIYPYRHWLRMVLRQAWAPFRPREVQRPWRPARSPEQAWACAALLIVRRDEFLSVGGFDPKFFLYGEDLELSRRYQRHGFEVRLTEAIVGHHAGAASSPSEDDLRVFPLAWSVLGTLQYLCIWESERVAARAARIVLGTFRLQRRLLGLLVRVPGVRGRASRKRRQIEQIESFVLGERPGWLAEIPGEPYCADVDDLFRRVRGAGRAGAASGKQQ